MPFLWGDLVPEDTYPVLHMYLTALVLRVGALIDPHGPAGEPSWPQVVVGVRLLNAALGTVTVGLLAGLGRRLFGWRVGLLAAALLALSPVSIVNAHYEMGDVAQTLFVVAAVAAAGLALRSGSAAAILATGALAGLAASAKFFGVVVLATALVAVVGGRRRPPAHAVLLLIGACVLTGAAFVLSTPLLLLEPGRWLSQVRASPELFIGNPPPVLRRFWLGSRVVLGLAGEWFGLPQCLAALAGVALLARRGGRGALVLTTPAIVLAIYVWFRPHGLDDRYLVILAPFVALAAGVAVVGLGRWSRRLALGAALALVALGTVDALHVAYLFWTDDTRQLALRWRERALPPDARPTSLPGFAQGGPSAESAILVTDTQSDDRHHVWYSAQQKEWVIRAVARLEREGKLLRRFELLPRGFTAPTISYYDLESMDVPYAFPPPDAVVSDEAVVFLDPDAVPDRAAVVVTPGHPRTWTLVSRAPVPRLALALAGEGRIRVRSGLRTRAWSVDARRATIVEIAPWRGFPWFKPVYRLGSSRARAASPFACSGRPARWPSGSSRSRTGRAPSVSSTPAGARAGWSRPASSISPGRARGPGSWPRPARPSATFSGPRPVCSRASSIWPPARTGTRGGHATRSSSAAAASPGTGRSPGPRRSRARRSSARSSGTPAASGGQFLRAAAGVTPAGALKIWLPEHFLRGRYLATFRVRGAPAAGGPIARLEVVRHLPGRGYDSAASLDWTPRAGPAGWEDVVLPFTTDQEPVDFELQVHYHGRGTLDMDRATIMPDVRAALAERVATLVTIPAAPAPPR